MKDKILLSIVTPEKVYLTERKVDFVALPASEGEMGILPGHISFVVHLKDGFLRYSSEGEEEMFAILGGFAQVDKNKVIVLAEGAELTKEIDEELARQEYQKAKDDLSKKGAAVDLDAANASLRRSSLRIKALELKGKLHRKRNK
ncbi:MAG: ATP synthase F1 subunit epsilon [Bacteroidales bacterium]|jgi:F-type H+-transporting ATPase subunit epsilon|nr:ATP synthase F1 subunit epsilon [Bacteroidales bacterium]